MVPTLTYLAKVGLLATVYVAVARFGLGMDAVSDFASLVWPSSGLALAALLLYGRDLWPGIAIGAAVANAWTGAPIPVALGIAAGNTAEALLGAYLLQRLPGFRPALDRLQDVLGLIVLAALVSTTVSATIGVTSLGLGQVLPPGGFGTTWRAWWMGDAISDLVVAPLLLTWGAARRTAIEPKRLVEGLALAAALIVVSLHLFAGVFGRGVPAFGQPTTLLPLLIWAALRFGTAGAAGATFVVSAVAIGSTALGRGPFVQETLYESLELLQGYVAVIAVTFLLGGALMDDRKRADAERGALLRLEQIARRDAEEAARLRDEMLAVVSHDLRNPLSAVAATVASLLKKVSDAEARGQVVLVQRGLARMERLVNDLLDSAKITAGRLSLERRPHDATQLAREAVEQWESVASERQVRLARERTDTACPVLCDRERILQAVSNLLSNALRVTPERGSVDVSVRGVGGEVQISVRDTGPGIAPEHVAHVFERYWRAPGQTADGAGLGLFIAKGIVEAHGGRIWAESLPGRGAAFFIGLPRAEPQA